MNVRILKEVGHSSLELCAGMGKNAPVGALQNSKKQQQFGQHTDGCSGAKRLNIHLEIVVLEVTAAELK